MRYIHDTFTDTNGVDLSAHTPEIDRQGGGYAEIAGDWEILSNEAKTTSAADARVVIDSGIYDGQFSIDMKVGLANGAAYLIFRANAACTNYWVIGLDDATQRMLLYSVTAGAFTLRAEKPFTQDEATWYRVKAFLQGDDIKAYVDDVLILSHTSALYNTQTVMGFYAELNPDARFDSQGGDGDGDGDGIPGDGIPAMAEDRLPCLYCVTADVKGRMGVQWTSGAALDAVLNELINSASRLIEDELYWPYCYFAAADLADQTRYFDTEAGTEMWIPRCISISSFWLDTTGNGVVDTQWVQGTDFVVWPYDKTWFTKIIVKEGASRSFPTGQRRLQIIGKFGGYPVPPQVIKEACIITVARWAKRAQQMYQDTGAIVELGQLIYTKALDPDVQEILRVTERRVVIG